MSVEAKRKYREANRQRIREVERLAAMRRRTANPEKQMLANAKARAKREGLDFNITIEDLIVPVTCPVLGVPLEFNIGGGCITNNSPSLDKLVPELGYVKGNVRVISHKANRLKSDLSIQEIIRLADYVQGKL